MQIADNIFHDIWGHREAGYESYHWSLNNNDLMLFFGQKFLTFFQIKLLIFFSIIGKYSTRLVINHKIYVHRKSHKNLISQDISGTDFYRHASLPQESKQPHIDTPHGNHCYCYCFSHGISEIIDANKKLRIE